MTKGTNPDRFKTRKEALNWLQTQGYKVSQGKFYTDCTAGQKITVHLDGTVSKWETYQYATKELNIRSGTATGDTLAGEQIRKIRAEADLKELQFEIATRQRDKYWLHADDAWASVAALIGTLRDAIRHHLASGKQKIVASCNGEHDRAGETFECCEGIINRAFNEVAGDEINVEFTRDVEADSQEEVIEG